MPKRDGDGRSLGVRRASGSLGSGVRRRAERVRALAFVLPVVGLVVAFIAIPLVYAVRYSFTQWDGISPARPVGLGNYRYLYHLEAFREILVNNLVLLAGLAVWVTAPMVIALVLHRRRGGNAIRATLLLPILLPPVIVGALFRIILSDSGPVNAALAKAGLAEPWLENRELVLATIIAMIAWAVLGLGVLFYSSGLAAIPHSYAEAAELDGARWRQVAWYVYRPALRPLTRFWLLLLTIATVTSFFPWIFSLTAGGPGVASTTIDFYVYQLGIVNGQYGLGSAVAVVGLVFVLSVIVLQLTIRRVRSSRV